MELQKGRRQRKRIEPKVKVNAPVVEEVTGKAPAAPESQFETGLVSTLLFLFSVVIIEGLVLAGSVSMRPCK